MNSFTRHSRSGLEFDRAVSILSNTGWLKDRSPSARDLILSCGRIRRHAANETIYHVGDPADGLHGLVEGGVQITLPSDDGTDFVGHREDAGFWIGDLALFAEQKRLVSVFTTRPSLTLFLPQPRLLSLVSAHPELFRDFYALSHANTAIALRLLANLSVSNSEKRLSLRLLHYAEITQDQDGWIKIPQEMLARMVAVSLPTLQRILRRLGDQGLVEVGYSRLRVLDRERLVTACQD